MPGHHEDLKRALRTARSQAGIKADSDLAFRAGVHLQTLQNWMSGKTTPRPAELSKVANALGVRMDDLMAAYEGRNPQPPPLQDAIRELVGELRLSRVQQHESTIALLRAVGALTSSVLASPETPAGTENGPAVDTRRDRRP